MPTELTNLEGFSANAELSSVVRSLAGASIRVAEALRTTFHASAEIGTNVQGETVKQLDQVADDLFTAALRSGQGCTALISEEREQETAVGNGKFLVAIDPLDGSSNLDSTVPVGSIFGIYSGSTTWENSLGRELSIVAAGFVSYGILPSMYLSTTHGAVSQYKLDWSSESWRLTNPQIRIPTKPGVFSSNEANFDKWGTEDQDFLMRARKEIGSSRYSGSLVADCEKILLKGGLFAYPRDTKSPDGKLRLFYECLPMTAIITGAGGAGSDGWRSILNVPGKTIHQRTPLFLGNRSLLEGRI